MAAGPNLISIDAFPATGQRTAWGDALGSISLACKLAEGAAPSGDIGVTRSASGAVLARLRSTPQQITNERRHRQAR